MRIEQFDNQLFLVAEEDHLLIGRPRYFATPTSTSWWCENIRDPEDSECIERTKEMLYDMFVEIPDGDYRDILMDALYGGGDIE